MIVDDHQPDRERLKEWLPRLAHFQSLLESDPSTFDLRDDQPSAAARAMETATSVARMSRQQIVHLPLDGIVSKMTKVNPFVLGLGCIGQRDQELLGEISDQIALGCASKSGRHAVVIRIRQEGNEVNRMGSARSETASSFVNHRETMTPHHVWHDFGESKMEKLRWNTQLLELLRLRKEYGLILIDLGDAESQAMVRLGRLCDGVVIQMMDQVSPRTMKTVLNTLKMEQLKLLGILSLECISDPLRSSD